MQRCQRCVLGATHGELFRHARVKLRNFKIVRRFLTFSLCWLLLALSVPSWATEGMEASTSKAARQEAIKAIPLKKVNPRYRSAVQNVLRTNSLYRRLPTQMVDCNPELFTFLAQNPEMLVEVWRYLGITKVELQRTGANSFRLADNAGTTGKLTIVEQDCNEQAQNRIVMYAEGAYEGRPFKQPVRAQCVLLLRSGSLKETNDRDYVAARLDSFIHIDRTSIELFAKAVHPLVGRTADRNFGDTLTFVSNFSAEAETRPSTIEKLVSRLPHVSSDRKDRLIQIAYYSSADDKSRTPSRPSSIRRVARVED